MFVPVTVSMNGEVQYQRGFEMLSKQARDMTVPLSHIGRRLIEGVGRQFATEGGWSGNPWTNLSESYGAWKESKVPGLPKLIGIVRTGKPGMRPQTYQRSGRMLAEMIDPASLHVSPQRMIYAPTSGVAGYHEFGTDRMPARPPVELPLTELHEWDRTFVRWLNGLIVSEGLA
jgi:hypothetical protein